MSKDSTQRPRPDSNRGPFVPKSDAVTDWPLRLLRNGGASVRYSGWLTFMTFVWRCASVSTSTGISLAVLLYGCSFSQTVFFIVRNTCTVLLFSQDVNDNPPVFASDGYTAFVQENLPAGAFVIQVSATDADSDKRGKITYFLGSGTSEFTINGSTGVIRTRLSFNREITPLYSMTVGAQDSGSMTLITTVNLTVFVADTNDNAPHFKQSFYNLEWDENSPSTNVALLALDLDLGPNQIIRYSILSGNVGNTFYLTRKGGILVATKPLDRENTSSYSLLVQVCDTPVNPNDTLCGTARVNVTIKDDNDNSPVFDPAAYNAGVPEDAKIGVAVSQVFATDKDSGLFGLVRYEMNDPTGKFAINATSGVIRVAGRLDREDLTAYSLRVRAVDSDPHGPRSATAMVTIAVLDVNDFAPVFTQQTYSVNVSQRITVGQRVFNMTAVDVDAGLNALVTYSLEAPSSHFTIDSSTGMVTTRSQLQTPSSPYRLSILAQDSGTPRLNTSAQLLVTVLPPSQTPPRFLQDVKIIYRQSDIFPKSRIDTLQAISDNPNINLNYELLGVTPASNPALFEVGVISGEVKTLQTVSFAQNSIYKLHVRAYDPLQPGDEAKMVLQVQSDTLQHVFLHFTPPLSATFAESLPINSVVLTVRASSDFTQSQPKYSIIAGNHNDTFRIASTNGSIITNRELDFETRSFYSLSVLATDTLNLSRPTIGTVNLRLTDINDNQPVWTLRPTKPIMVPENTPLRSAIAQLRAEDRDSDGLTYQLKTNSGFFFNISAGGEISLSRSLDYETKRNYTLVVVAKDKDFEISTTVIIEVEDINDNSPIFSPQTQRKFINEKSPRGITIAQVTATDADTGANGRIRYRLRNSFGGTFAIDSITGNITLLRSLTFNKTSDNLYLISVVAFDSGMPSLEASGSVFVEVIDINDHTPMFTQAIYDFTVSEAAGIQTRVGRVAATDGDSDLNALLTFGIVTGSKTFSMNQNDGTIYLLKRLDRELVMTYRLNISVKDGGSPERTSYATVIVHVSDVNDHAPVFNESEYSVRLDEDFPTSRMLLQVFATDADTGSNANVRYSITGGNQHTEFRIDHQLGQIFALIPLRHASVYHLEITAQDGAPPFHKTSVKVNIVIFKHNQTVPLFTRSLYFASINESTGRDQQVAQVKALLPVSRVGLVLYSFASNTSREVTDIFLLGATSGYLSLRNEVDFETTRRYDFWVKAVDQSQPDQASYAQVIVMVTNVNEFRPSFTQPEYRFTVATDKPISWIVGTVSAMDSDDDARLTYFFSRVNTTSLAGLFRISQSTGQISVISNLQGQQRQTVNSTVIAYDGALTGTAKITISIVSGGVGEESTGSGSSNLFVIIGVTVVIFFALIVIISLIVILRRRNRTDKQPITSGYAYAESSNNHRESVRNLLNGSTSSAGHGSQRLDSSGSEAQLMMRQSMDKLSTIRDDVVMTTQLSNGNSFYDSTSTNTTTTKVPLSGYASGGSDRAFPFKGAYYTAGHEQFHEFEEEGAGEAYGGMGGGGSMDVNTLLYHKLAEIEAEEHEAIMDGTRCFVEEALTAEDRAASLGSVYRLADEFVAGSRRSWLDNEFKGLDDSFLELAKPPTSSGTDPSSAPSVASSRVASSFASGRNRTDTAGDDSSNDSSDEMALSPDSTPILHAPTSPWAKSPRKTAKASVPASILKNSTVGREDLDVSREERQDALDELIGMGPFDEDSGSDQDLQHPIIFSDYEAEEV